VRWLLNNVPTGVLGLLIVGTITGLAAIAATQLRKRNLESTDFGGAMDPLGVVGVAYGLVLALVIFGLWNNYDAAKATVSAEAGSLAQIAVDAGALDAADEAIIDRSLSRYIRVVVTDEWKRMKDGRESRRAHEALDELAVALQQVRPSTKVADVWYQESVTQLNEALTARRQRIDAVREQVPGVFRLFIFGGAIVPIGFMILLCRRRMHTLLMAAVVAILAYTLFIAIVLDYPFSGKVSVSTAPYHQGHLTSLAP
jgi:hypothetical protein